MHSIDIAIIHRVKSIEGVLCADSISHIICYYWTLTSLDNSELWSHVNGIKWAYFCLALSFTQTQSTVPTALKSLLWLSLCMQICIL